MRAQSEFSDKILVSSILLILLGSPGLRAEHPSDGWIVWASDRQDSRHEIYIMAADGSGVTRLTTTGARMPMWSPDGRWIAYETVPAGTTRVMRWDKSEDKEIFSGAPKFWLADGSRIVCMDSSKDLHLVDPETGQSSPWLQKSEFSQMAPKDWSPSGLTSDGRWLVTWTDLYRSGYSGSNGQFTAHHSAVILDLNNKGDVFFFGSGCEPTTPPSGDWVYHVCGGGVCSTYPDVYRMQVSDRASRSSYSAVVAYDDPQWGHEYFPRISTDGDWLVYGATTGNPACHAHDDCDYEIFIHRLGGTAGNRERLTAHSDNDQWPHLYVGPLWSSQPPQLSSIELSVDHSPIMPDGSTTIWAYPKDQFGAAFSSPISWSMDGGGSLNPEASPLATEHSTIFQSNGAEGDFTVSAESDGVQGQAVVQVTSSSLPIQINCGSNSFDVVGWQRDDDYVSGGADWDNPDQVDVAGVVDAAPQQVYQSVRHSSPHAYSLNVPDGSYLLRLHFADKYGDRAMNYTAEGEQILSDFDIVSEAGGVNLALVKEFVVQVSDGDGLQLEAQSSGDVFEAGLELFQWSDEEPQPDGDGGTTSDGEDGDNPDGADGDLPDGGDLDPRDGGDLNPDSGVDSDQDEPELQGGCDGCASAGPGGASFLSTLMLGLLLLHRRRNT